MGAKPSFKDFVLFWLKIGCISFGGPAAHIALMHREVVERLKWIDEKRFSHALGFCMLLPGPEAQQLAAYIGWLLHGTRGAVAAGSLFVIPSALLLWGLSVVYVLGGQLPAISGFFQGLQPVVMALILLAAWRMGRRLLISPLRVLIAAGAFLMLVSAHATFPLVILLCGLGGFLRPRSLGVTKTALEQGEPLPPKTARAGWMALALWLVPVGLLVLFERGLLAHLAVFFSTTSILTFGGAYAILPYVAQEAVRMQWLTAGQMLSGLGLAESTPGPLIIVLQFVGFVAGWNQPGTWPPLAAATVGAAIACWTTFLPSLVWILLGARHVERLRSNLRLSGALAAISSGVVGIVLSLALWFGQQMLFPDGKWNPGNTAIFLCALAANRMGVVPLILGGGLIGVIRAAWLN